ncbi:MAG: peptide MFS transporter [Saprospiraceae bacterium]|nr:peptide MFS transporter [Saprospiraceae bacterium]
MFKKHPKSLPYLFFSEMWERFGYYLMIGIFTLYLKDVKEGFGMTEAESADLYGTFIALVFFTPFIGGLLADRYLGYRRSIIMGGLMMGAGYCLMFFHSLTILYIAMTLVILGNGFFKPNISTMLGNIYNRPDYVQHKDEGYNIFYMGINIGAFTCNFFGAALYTMLGWGYAFLAAGVGMFIGVIVFILGIRHYQNADLKKGVKEGDMSMMRICMIILLPSLLAGILGWLLGGITTDANPNGNFFGSDSNDAFLFACIPVVYYYFNLWYKSPAHEKGPVAALLAIFVVVILFWAVFKQNGSALNTWADRYTDRQVTGATGELFTTLKQAKPLVYKKDTVALYDALFRIQKENGVVLKDYNYPVYFRNMDPVQLPAEGTSINLWITSLSQSINPGWVILLTPLLVAFFAYLGHRNKEPSTASKIAMGLLVSSLSVLIMIAAVNAGNNGTEKVSVWWLIGSYGVITLGELLLSPMGLSMVSKLSPPHITSLMMGGWFVSTSMGNKLSGVLASSWDRYEDKSGYFWVNFALLSAAAVAGFILLRWLNRILKEHKLN